MIETLYKYKSFWMRLIWWETRVLRLIYVHIGIRNSSSFLGNIVFLYCWKWEKYRFSKKNLGYNKFKRVSKILYNIDSLHTEHFIFTGSAFLRSRIGVNNLWLNHATTCAFTSWVSFMHVYFRFMLILNTGTYTHTHIYM